MTNKRIPLKQFGSVYRKKIGSRKFLLQMAHGLALLVIMGHGTKAQDLALSKHQTALEMVPINAAIEGGVDGAVGSTRIQEVQ